MSNEEAQHRNVKEEFTRFIHQLQDEICAALENADGTGKFVEDKWERPGGGGGKTRIINGGSIIEKGGVNTSVVHGPLPKILKDGFAKEGEHFFACGLSLVLHPENPFIPTVHANFRYFEMYDADGRRCDSWFGGGSDLTPYYLFEEDASHFHRVQKKTCDKFREDLYPRFKKNCDEYFRNHHRNEGRGIGGTFYDHLRPAEWKGEDELLRFSMSMGRSFLPSYLPILEKRKSHNWNDDQKFWQEIRRGRYVEFNLVHDRGTLFGLKTNGRIESILMSLPPQVRWEYDHQPEPGSAEEKIVDVLKNTREWI